MAEGKAPGLKWIKRPGGAEPYWCAPPAAKRAGYDLNTVRLVGFEDDLAAQCGRLQAQMLRWLAGTEGDAKIRADYDGSIRALLTIYQTNPESSYRKLKRTSREPYDHYAKFLVRGVGHRRVASISGLDLQRWHAEWTGDDGRLPRASMMLHVLKAALRFGSLCGLDGCQNLLTMAHNLRLPKPKPRTQAPTAADITRARGAAHALGRPRAALGYALQFEATLRAWDVIGQWVPMSDPRPSAILWRGMKWFGPTWSDIDENMILTITPSKTERTSGKRVSFDLREMPMVMEEIIAVRDAKPMTSAREGQLSAIGRTGSAALPTAATGPLIINEATGMPYTDEAWGQTLWHRVRAKAGLPTDLWNRDIRAGGVTEGGKAGATSDDRMKVAGHSKPKQIRETYDRDVLVSARRVSELRKAFREGK